MADTHLDIGTTVALQKIKFHAVITELQKSGYTTLGPVVKDNTIAYKPIQKLADLPRGYTSEEAPGKYRLSYAGHGNYFTAAPGSDSWKQFFFPPRTELVSFHRNPDDPHKWEADSERQLAQPLALIGVRACELAAIQVQDRVFMREDYKDPVYRERRQSAFIVAVNCLHPCETCFCTSFGIGPEATEGYDLLLTELDDVFLIKIGSEAGRTVMSSQAFQPASAFLVNQAAHGLTEARDQMQRHISEPERLPGILLNDLDNPRFDDVAQRCISCGNCTQVCPTCFCWDTREINSLSGETAGRERVWDSCFNPEYSYVFGGNTRPNVRSRYRQWITHKFGSWWKQFGTAGCVGCGRCITWCPAGIDITEEANALAREVVA
jgi:formate hydrogenlyase subunit 6/NADH:ubiquinone oxidoreductase subunit I